jgi:hypothetical protein
VTGRRLIPYPEERALEDAAFGHGVAPVRIHSLLLPLFQVEITATTTEGHPYELIDRYLERGIAEGDLRTVPELADFFALDHVLVDRAVRFLTAVGHLTAADGRLTLTPIGERSVQDGVRYVVTREDRRTLYFDAFGSRPLTRPYYDSRTVTMLRDEALSSAASDGSRFTMLTSTRGFRRAALTELANRPDRDRFNLPERVDNPTSLGGEEHVYLPLFVVRVMAPAGAGHLVYGPAGDRSDPDLTDLIEQTPEIVQALEADERRLRGRPVEAAVNRWLAARGRPPMRPTPLPDGGWRVVLRAEDFGPDAVPVQRAGSFQVFGGEVVHVWCDDERIRRRAMLERTSLYLSARRRPDRDGVENFLDRITRQLQLSIDGLPELARAARDAGRPELARQLDGLAKPTTDGTA